MKFDASMWVYYGGAVVSSFLLALIANKIAVGKGSKPIFFKGHPLIFWSIILPPVGVVWSLALLVKAADFKSVDQIPAQPVQPAQPAEYVELKTCPFCAEPIRKAAIVCKHCSRDLPAITVA